MIKLEDVYQPLTIVDRVGPVGFGQLEGWVSGFKIDFDPVYQRGHEWTERQRRLFVGHVLSGGEVLPLLLNIRGDRFLGRFDQRYQGSFHPDIPA